MKNGRLVTCATKDDLAEGISQFPAEGKDESGIWHIYSADGLKAWRDAANDDPSASAALHNSIDLSGVDWSPVESEFAGFFDGGGHSIIGIDLSYNITSAPDKLCYSLLFDYVAGGATVSGVTLRECRLSVTIGDLTGNGINYDDAIHVAGVAADVYGTVRDCAVFKSEFVLSSSSNHSSGVSAVVGALFGSGAVINCMAVECDVSGTAKSYNGLTCAGVVGSLASGANATAMGLAAIDCNITSIDISSSSDTTASGPSAGGVISWSNSGAPNAVAECVAQNCVVSCKSDILSVYAGGVASGGYSYDSCLAAGCTVSAETGSGTYAWAGGAVGYVSNLAANCVAQDCAVSSANGSSYSIAGGALGCVYGQATGCVAQATSVAAQGYGESYAGGVIGLLNNGSIAACTCINPSSVTASSSAASARAGGVICQANNYCNITGCILANTSGSVITIAASAPSGAGYAGGIVAGTNSSKSCVLSSSANLRSTDTLSASGTTTYIGGAIGYLASSGIATGNANLTYVTKDIGNQ